MRERLRAAGLRVELDDRGESVGRKIREAELRKIPNMLVVGDRRPRATACRYGASRRRSWQRAVAELVETLLSEMRARGEQEQRWLGTVECQVSRKSLCTAPRPLYSAALKLGIHSRRSA